MRGTITDCCRAAADMPVFTTRTCGAARRGGSAKGANKNSRRHRRDRLLEAGRTISGMAASIGVSSISTSDIAKGLGNHRRSKLLASF